MSTIVRQISLLQFLRYAALGLSAPYVTVYLTNMGLSGTEIGVLISIAALLELIIIPMLNLLADRLGNHRRLYAVITLAMGIANGVFALTGQPFLLKGAFLLNKITIRANNTLLSQLTVTRLDQIKRDIFGRVRLWGSVGWAVATIISGPLIALASYPLAFLGSALVSFAMLPVIQVLPRRTAEKQQIGQTEPRRRSFYILAASQFIFFIGVNGVITFLWVYFERDLGVAPEYIGGYAAVFALSELIPMLLIDRIIAWLGIRRTLIIGMTGMSITWVLYALLPDATWLIPLQLLRGTAFTMFIIGITLLVTRTSAPVNVATNQAIIQVTMPALAMLLTGPPVGWIFDVFGADALFCFSMTMGLLAVGVLIWNYDRLVSKTTATGLHPVVQATGD